MGKREEAMTSVVPAPACHEHLKGLKFTPLERAAQYGWGLQVLAMFVTVPLTFFLSCCGFMTFGYQRV